MRRSIFVRPISDAEREALEEGLRSSDAFDLRRCQILLQSSRGENAYRIVRSLGCDSQTARTAIKRFNEGGLQEALRKRSSRPKRIRAAFDGGRRAERLRELLHRSPREFGKETSLGTLALAAEVSFEEGITEERVTAETVRTTLERMGCAGCAPNAGSPPPTRSTKGKRRRDRLIRPAAGNDGWVVGFEDETWWSKEALPSLHAWSEDGKPSRLV